MDHGILKKQTVFLIILILLFSFGSLFLIFNEEEQPNQVEVTTEQQLFIDEIASEAKLLQKQTHLFASITIAQAILESDWGRSDLAIEANNLFGIKGAFNEQSSIMPTDEFIDGERVTIDDSFKKYETIQESMVDHMEFLKGDSYEETKKSKNYRTAAIGLQKGGYATDPEYAEKLIQLIEEFKLYTYDV